MLQVELSVAPYAIELEDWLIYVIISNYYGYYHMICETKYKSTYNFPGWQEPQATAPNTSPYEPSDIPIGEEQVFKKNG